MSRPFYEIIELSLRRANQDARGRVFKTIKKATGRCALTYKQTYYNAGILFLLRIGNEHSDPRSNGLSLSFSIASDFLRATRFARAEAKPLQSVRILSSRGAA